MSLHLIRKSAIGLLLLAGYVNAQQVETTTVSLGASQSAISSETAQINLSEHDNNSDSTASVDPLNDSEPEGLGDPYEYAMEEIVVTPHWIEIPDIELEPIPLPEVESRFNSKIDTYMMAHGNRYIRITPPGGKPYCLEIRDPNPLELADYGAFYVIRC
ncbi:MAG: hypothetical protein AAF512_13985 [Pseudomonadota bacterium]